jgi:ferredoxin
MVEERAPLSLGCGHTFCGPCAGRVRVGGPCHACRTPLRKGSVTRCYAIQSLADSL